MDEPVKLMIVDDSAFFRRVIRKMVDSDERLVVVGEAANGRETLERLTDLAPDVIFLDIHMPEMDGLTALKHIMIKHPRPTVMLSAFTRPGATETFDSLKFGAVDFIQKPSRLGENGDMNRQQAEIVRKALRAARVATRERKYIKFRSAVADRPVSEGYRCDHLFAMGAAEGAYGALLKIIPRLDPDIPAAFVIVIHDADPHVAAFAEYLDRYSLVSVRKGEDCQRVKPGCCYLFSGDKYVTFRTTDDAMTEIQAHRNPFPDRRGAVNMLMFSLAEHMGKQSAGILLSGDGNDGEEGVREIARVGGITIAQDPETCLCRDMPMASIQSGGAFLVVADDQMAAKINRIYMRPEKAKTGTRFPANEHRRLVA